MNWWVGLLVYSQFNAGTSLHRSVVTSVVMATGRQENNSSMEKSYEVRPGAFRLRLFLLRLLSSSSSYTPTPTAVMLPPQACQGSFLEYTKCSSCCRKYLIHIQNWARPPRCILKIKKNYCAVNSGVKRRQCHFGIRQMSQKSSIISRLKWRSFRSHSKLRPFTWENQCITLPRSRWYCCVINFLITRTLRPQWPHPTSSGRSQGMRRSSWLINWLQTTGISSWRGDCYNLHSCLLSHTWRCCALQMITHVHQRLTSTSCQMAEEQQCSLDGLEW